MLMQIGWRIRSALVGAAARPAAAGRWRALLVLLLAAGGMATLAGPVAADTPSAWTQQQPATIPTGRNGAAMAFDPYSDQFLLFGSYSGRGFLSDTWAWNGSTWMQSHPASHQLFLFGGFGNRGVLSDTWTYYAPLATTASLASSANPSVYGQSVTFTATVAPKSGTGTPTGTVTFSDGTTTLGSASLTTATCTDQASISTAGLAEGPHSITATYAGDSTFAGTSAAVIQKVHQDQTTTTVAAALGPATFGQPVTFTATVAAGAPGAGAPSGTVTFAADGVALGTGTLAGQTPDQATLTSHWLSVGNHGITASYGGDTDFAVSATTSTITESVSCTRTVTGSAGRVVVSSGATCITTGTTVAGSILVEPGAALWLDGATVGGGIQSTSASALAICGSTLGGLSARASTGYLLIGGSGDADAWCAANTVKGAVVLEGNQSGLELGGNQIGGRVKVTNTMGSGPDPEDASAEIEGNRIAGSLTCSGNTLAPTDGGQPNTVSGSRLGQCATTGF